MMGRFEGKVVLVSGAARGQGRSHALRFAEEGADIVALDILDQIGSVPYEMSTGSDLDETIELVKQRGRRIEAQRADVRSWDRVRDAVSAGVDALGPIDVVCANAGIITYGAAWDLTTDQWEDTIDTNLTGVWYTIRAALPSMMNSGRGGSIIATSSFAGLRGPANALSYVAAKHGVVGLVRALANELGRYNIRVNSVHPTTVDTDMVTNDATYRLFRPDLESPTREDCLDGLSAMQALPIPYVSPGDISDAVLWLASDEAKYVTGVQLPVDGGAANK